MNNKQSRYPIGIVSKGRHESMLTSKALTEMHLYHYICIEPQDEENYKAALVKFNLQKYVTLLILPFSNHGDGPGRARNWFWDFTDTLNAKRHWVLDDNIRCFYRLYKNNKIRYGDATPFRAAEEFVDRYENVPVSGFQYECFVPSQQKRNAFARNTRIYSCLLIDNSCRHRWRGRYNEDTDLCIRVLKDGDCTIQFNSFLQDKVTTQLIKGGNTEEFYHKELVKDPTKLKAGKLNPLGTIRKSQMLVDMHPDICKMVWRYGRVHHQCDYSSFKKNKLKLKADNFPIREYNIKLIEFDDKEQLYNHFLDII